MASHLGAYSAGTAFASSPFNHLQLTERRTNPTLLRPCAWGSKTPAVGMRLRPGQSEHWIPFGHYNWFHTGTGPLQKMQYDVCWNGLEYFSYFYSGLEPERMSDWNCWQQSYCQTWGQEQSQQGKRAELRDGGRLRPDDQFSQAWSQGSFWLHCYIK